MASISEMAASVGGAFGDGLDAVEEFMGMGDTVKDASTVVGGAARETDGLIDSLASGSKTASEVASGDSVFGGLKDWTTQALSKQMPGILAAAMKPKFQQRAPLGGSGHGVQASAGSNGSVINEIEGLAGGDPLQGLSGFKNLL